jgi:hypothetical protein
LPEWHVSQQKQKPSRREALSKPLYRAVQDLGSLLVVQDGCAKMPSHQEQLEAI